MTQLNLQAVADLPPALLRAHREESDQFQVAQRLAQHLEKVFHVEFAIFEGPTGQTVRFPEVARNADWDLVGQLCCEVDRRGRFEFIRDDDPLLFLAIPLEFQGRRWVAVATVLVGSPAEHQALAVVEQWLGLETNEAAAWLDRQPRFTVDALERLADVSLTLLRSEERNQKVQAEADSLAAQIASTYEEITLLYRLTQNLKLSQSDEDLCRHALGWLREVIPAEGLAIRLAPLPDADGQTPGLRTEPVMLIDGDCPIDNAQFGELIAESKLHANSRPLVANRRAVDSLEWKFPGIRELVLVPVADGETLFGWLAAFNHRGEREFGTDEAQLLASVGTILGTHAQNADLYRQRAELLAGVVRALTSAIDAKDPYTCGHSDRVARVSVRLGQDLGLDNEALKTLYLSGLLHDIGKIGIDENILRKPGRLTPAEYEHIKTHPEIGYNILIDLKRLAPVLPGVRHHHEAWDGTGYPVGLSGENIPFIARIMAVADAFDAMGSDRPYRKGMADQKLDAILREGAGTQWDPQVIEAYFRIRDDLRHITHREQDEIDPDVPQWVSPGNGTASS
jgi:HD-GYP domain-containing protein (c-di-GMP phosphodiesterase class II)